MDGVGRPGTIAAAHSVLGEYHLHCEGDAPLLFTENSTHHARLGLDYPDIGPYLKDGLNNYVVHGRREAVNPEMVGTKAAAYYRLTVRPGASDGRRTEVTGDELREGDPVITDQITGTSR